MSHPSPPQSPSPGDHLILPTRTGCIRRFPKHYRDFKLSLAAPLPYTIPEATQPKPLDQDQSVPLVDLTPTPPIPNLIETEPDSFGLYHVYTDCPKVDPADEACVYDMCDAPTFTTPAPSTLSSHVGTRIKETFFTPFLNLTIYRLFGWFYNGNITKSIEDLNDLVVYVLLAPDFEQGHLERFDAMRELD